MKFLALPHYFTLFRILIAPLFPLFYFEYEFLGIPLSLVPYLLLFLLFIGECSDLFDGFIARKKNQVTELGKILDPIADSIMRITIFFTFTGGLIRIPFLLAFVFLYRDLFMSGLRTICALKGIALAARKSGKLKAIIQAIAAFATVFLMLLHTMGYISLLTLQKSSYLIVLSAAIYTALSLVDYLYANKSFIKKVVR